MVDRARLESVCTERYRGFESRPLRQVKFAGMRKTPKRPVNTAFAGLFRSWRKPQKSVKKRTKTPGFFRRTDARKTLDFTGVSEQKVLFARLRLAACCCVSVCFSMFLALKINILP